MSIRLRFLLFYLPLTALSVWVMTVFSRDAVQTALVHQVIKRAQSTMEEVLRDPGLAAGIADNDEARVLPDLWSIFEYGDFLYVAAIDLDGRVVAHTNVVERGKHYGDAFSRKSMATETSVHEWDRSGDRLYLRVSCPVVERVEESSGEAFLLMGAESETVVRRGTLLVGVPVEEALGTASSIAGHLFWIITIVSALTAAGCMIFAGRIVSRIRALARATEAVRPGTPGGEVKVDSDDEVGDLARRFNRMRERLAETTVSKEFLDSILGNMLDLLIVTTSDGHVRMANRSAFRLLEYEPEDLLGKYVLDLLEFPGPAREGREIAERVQIGLIQNIEGTLLTRTGQRIPILFSASPFHDDDGTLAGYIVSAADITDRKREQDRNRQLERQFVNSERMASVGTAAAGIVHNLKNPLTVVLGNAEIMKLRSEGQPLLDRIIDSARQMNGMIETILAKSRRKSQREKIQLNNLLTRELEFLEADASFRHHVKRDVRLDRDLPPVFCVYTDLSQVFGNILRNAVEAMWNQSTQHLRVVTYAEGDRCMVEISDTGCGMSEETVSRIFEPFFTTKEGEEEGEPVGTGLGLHMVRELLEPYDAKIDVESEVGAGTTFRLSFPFASVDTSPDLTATQVEENCV